MKFSFQFTFKNKNAKPVEVDIKFCRFGYSQILCLNSYHNTIGQSSFISFTTRTARPLIKLKCSVLLVMYNWLNGFYRVMKGKYSITLLFFGSYTMQMRFVTKAPPINSIDSKCHTKGSRTCLIGYSDFISRELLSIAQGRTHTQTRTHTDNHMKVISRN